MKRLKFDRNDRIRKKGITLTLQGFEPGPPDPKAVMLSTIPQPLANNN